MSELQLKTLRYKIELEGYEETVAETTEFFGQLQTGLSLLSRIDYLTLSWGRAIERADPRAFLSVLISTISLLEMVIRITKSAEAAQIAYNAALAIGQALSGPPGWAALGVAAGVGVAVVPGLLTPAAPAEPWILEEERKRSIEWRASEPP